MIRLLSYFSVQTRILLLCLIGAVLTTVICSVLLWGGWVIRGIDSQGREFHRVSALTRDINIAALEMRRSEKDFVTRRDMQYDRRVREYRAAVERLTLELRKLPAAAPVRMDIERILSGIQNYQSAYDRLGWAVAALWSGDNGGHWKALRQVEGEMREAVLASGSLPVIAAAWPLLELANEYALYGEANVYSQAERQVAQVLAALEQEKMVPGKKAWVGATVRGYLASLQVLVDADQAVRRATGEMSTIYAAFSPSFTSIVSFSERQEASLAQASRDSVTHILKLVAAVSAALVVVALAVAVVVARSVVVPLHGITAILAGGCDKDTKVDVPFTGNQDEIGQMARAVEVMTEAVQEMEKQRWVKSTVTELSGLIQQATTMQELAQVAISRLVPAVGGGIGGFYLFDEERKELHLNASYGYTTRKSLSSRFGLGDGLIGQAALERKPVLVSSPPENYISITSGTGAASPAVVLVQPVVSRQSLLGVIELASLRRYLPQELELLESMMPVIAMAMEILSRSLKTEQLLAESRHQAELLQKQTEDLWMDAFREAV